MNEKEAALIEEIRSKDNPIEALNILMNIAIDFIEEKNKTRKNNEIA